MTDFDAFWTRYPKKMEKPLARKAYQQALKMATHEEIMTGLERFIAAEPWKGDLHYCIFPERWLKRERWHDEYEAPKEDYGFRMEGGEKYNLTAFLANGTWRDDWGERPKSNATAKARLDELNAPRYGLKVVK